MLIWLFWVIFDWVIIIIGFLLPIPFSLLVIGNRQHALLILGHDGGHFHVSKNKRLNDFLTNMFCFFPFFIDISSYRRFHFQHHKYLGLEKDPELHMKNITHKNIMPEPLLKLKLIITDFFGLGLYEVSIFFIFFKSKFKDIIFKTIYSFIIFIIFYFFNLSYNFIIIWLVSIFTTQWLFFRIRSWSEHQGISETYRVFVPWYLRFLFPHNTWYHWEHHKNPNIPFYNLPKFSAEYLEPKPIKVTKLI